MTDNTSRRAFLRAAAGLTSALGSRAPLAGSLATMAALAGQSSLAADTSGPYRALVCVYLTGGNDSHNWLVPTEPGSQAHYAAARRELTWPVEQLQAIGAAGQAAGMSFGMPAELAPLRRWYTSGQAAWVANVGPLVRPISKADFQAGVGLPSKLFSHNDQTSTWQSMAPEGTRSGWGGRMGDILMSANAHPVFTAISATGNAVFLSGANVTQFQVNADWPVAVNGLDGKTVFDSTTASAALSRIVARSSSTDAAQAEYVRVLQRGISSNTVLQGALARVNVAPIPPTVIPLGNGTSLTLNSDNLARQLRMVAQLILAGQSLGMRRQVFMVSLGGFDTHANQMRDQPALMSRVAQSVDYFLSTVQAMGMLNNVALFTASDFGRTLLSNGAGSDHGWGSHHLVAGGMVAGGSIYGRFPNLALGGGDDVGSGRLLPSASVSQYAAPFGRWLGLSQAEVAAVLPGLVNFDASALRFL